MNSSPAVIEELRALVAEQATQLERQAAQLEEQAARLEEQAARITELELALAKAKKDSSTPNRPRATSPIQNQSEKSQDAEKNHAKADSPDTSDNYGSRCRRNALTNPSNTKSMTTKYDNSV